VEGIKLSFGICPTQKTQFSISFSSYIPWNIHEPNQGKFSSSHSKQLR